MAGPGSTPSEVQAAIDGARQLRVPVPDKVPTPVPGRRLSSLELKQVGTVGPELIMEPRLLIVLLVTAVACGGTL